MDLDNYLTFFQEFFEFFRKTVKRISKNSKSECVYVKYQLSSLYSNGLRQILDFFQDNFKNFFKKILNCPILKKVPKEHLKRHLKPKFEPISIFAKMILTFFDSRFFQ
jgi:hypothetical protein